MGNFLENTTDFCYTNGRLSNRNENLSEKEEWSDIQLFSYVCIAALPFLLKIMNQVKQRITGIQADDHSDDVPRNGQVVQVTVVSVTEGEGSDADESRNVQVDCFIHDAVLPEPALLTRPATRPHVRQNQEQREPVDRDDDEMPVRGTNQNVAETVNLRASARTKILGVSDIEKLKEENIQRKEWYQCIVCRDKLADWLLLGCGHRGCFSCLVQLTKCHSCRKPYELSQIKKIYF